MVQGRLKKKTREGVGVEEPSQKNIMVEKLCQSQEAALQIATTNNQDKEASEETRQKAMERLGETNKKKKQKKEDAGVGELQAKKNQKKHMWCCGLSG